jgi:hypothetical protein
VSFWGDFMTVVTGLRGLNAGLIAPAASISIRTRLAACQGSIVFPSRRCVVFAPGRSSARIIPIRALHTVFGNWREHRPRCRSARLREAETAVRTLDRIDVIRFDLVTGTSWPVLACALDLPRDDRHQVESANAVAVKDRRGRGEAGQRYLSAFLSFPLRPY